MYVECSIEELTRRDVKGLYEKAIKGEIANFTGVSDPYEEPVNPEVKVNSETESWRRAWKMMLGSRRWVHPVAREA